MKAAALLLTVLGFVMPTGGVLKRYANNRDRLDTSSMKAEGVVLVAPALARDVAGPLGIGWTSGELTLNAALSVRIPGRCRLELSSPETTKKLSVSVANGVLKREGPEVPALSVALKEACALLAVRSTEEGATRETLLGHLHDLKIETKNVALSRLGGGVSNVAYLIGQRAEGQPQLWVYKEVFQPARLRFTDEKNVPWDVRFSDFASQATDDVWPRVLEVSKGQEPQLTVLLQRADLKADLSSTVF